MKRIFLTLAVAAGVLIGCQENSKEEVLPTQQAIDMSDFYVETEAPESRGGSEQCHSMRVLNNQLKENPGLYKKMYDVEYATRKFIAAKKGGGKPGGGGNGGGGGTTPEPDNLGVINMPVYVHVVYSNSAQNVSDSRIAAQIQVLNDDFRKQNADASNIPSEFAGVATDSEINFTLAGTFRHSDSRASWGTNDAVKAAYPPVTPATHLNVWVCEIGGGILGYAQFPGGSSATDGVVLGHSTLPGNPTGPYNLGRTATHEVGHYLNLRHIWGDGRCRQDDFVADTPSSDAPNYGCPSYPTVNCKSNDMTMNYMDYTNDACMNMFTEGQKSRMRAIFAAGGARASMLN